MKVQGYITRFGIDCKTIERYYLATRKSAPDA